MAKAHETYYNVTSGQLQKGFIDTKDVIKAWKKHKKYTEHEVECLTCHVEHLSLLFEGTTRVIQERPKDIDYSLIEMTREGIIRSVRSANAELHTANHMVELADQVIKILEGIK